ncbi:serine/threonine-protein kinase STY13 [Pelomyxa schiedti]|nr:serine/threonine-protein kinase STY13 [Pelomyxa schiedti]
MEATRWLVTTTKRWPKGTSVDRIKELFPWTPPALLYVKKTTELTELRFQRYEAARRAVEDPPLFNGSLLKLEGPFEMAPLVRTPTVSSEIRHIRNIEPSHVQLLEVIGRGHFSVVYKALVDHEIMVVKQHAAGPHVTTMFGISTSGVPTLFLEKMAGTLDMLVHYPEQGFSFHIAQGLPFVTKLSLAIQVVLGITTAHCSNIVHGDLKLNNFLVDSQCSVKLSDFGCGHFVSKPEEGVRGACYYWAPELQSRGAMSTLESDVYSTGLILFEIFMEALPFGTLDLQTVMHEVAQGYRPDVPYSVSCPHSLNHCIAATPFLLANLITSCWHQDPCQRPHITSVLAGLKALATL